MSRAEGAPLARPHALDSEQSSLRLLFWLYVVVVVAYLFWRAAFTLGDEHPVFGLIFFAAEIFAATSSVVFYALVSKRPAAVSPPLPLRDPSVDVFITTYDESPELVRTTAVAARDMSRPHRTWICDDGGRAAIRALAESLGVGYITRPLNTNFKAGNLNHAMSRTCGELVVVLDADHVLAPEFLSTLLGHFSDPEIALVQIPQVYYNVDSYQHALSVGRSILWHEASLFHHRMQPGAGEYGAAFFVGTGAILRRSSLVAIGGFATGSVTEDIHTSIRLHAAGYRSVYVDRPMGYLLAPDTPLAYACQRLRWAQGAMQVLRREPRLWRAGLRPWQRIGYLNSLVGYFAAYQHLVFYLAPGIFLITGVSPISVDERVGFPIFAAYIAFSLAVYKTIAAPQARLFLGECYKMLNLAIHIRGSMTLLWPSGLAFRVTPKGAHRGLPIFLVAPAVGLFLFNLTAVGVGLAQIANGDSQLGALVLSTSFSAFFAVAGALAVVHAYERRGHAEPFVFPVSLRATLRRSGSGKPTQVQIRRLNHSVAYLVLERSLSVDQVGCLDLRAVGIDRPIHVKWIGQQVTRESGKLEYVLKVAFQGLADRERDQIDVFLFHTALPQFFARFRDASGPTGTAEARAATPSSGGEEFRFLPVRWGIV